jgi:hypothetical protein
VGLRLDTFLFVNTGKRKGNDFPKLDVCLRALTSTYLLARSIQVRISNSQKKETTTPDHSEQTTVLAVEKLN